MKARISAMMLAFTMALGVIGLANFAALSASAAETVVDKGEDHAASVTVSSTSPAEFTVGSGLNGQYYFYANITAPDIEDLAAVSLYVTREIGEPDESGVIPLDYYYLSYSAQLHAFYVMLDVTAGETLKFNTDYTDVTLSVSLWFDDLAIGGFNNNALYGVNLPVTLNLVGVAPDSYIVAVTPYTDLGTATLSAQVDDGTEVPLQANAGMYGAYTGTVAVTAASKTLTVHASAGESVSVGIELYAVISNVPELPETTHLNAYEANLYSYTAGENGYYCLNIGNVKEGETAVNDALFSILFKTNANDFVGVNIFENNHPVYMTEGSTYYFEVTYNGTEYREDEEGNPLPSPEVVSVDFKVEAWSPVTVAAGNLYYVPVAESENTYAVTLASGLTGEYTLSLLDIPEDATVVAHYGTASYNFTTYDNVVSVTLNATDTTLYFTSDHAPFVVGVQLDEYVDVTLQLGTPKTITLEPYFANAYYLYNLEAGTYSVTVSNGNGAVEVYAYSETAVSYGHTFGVFTTNEAAEEFGLVVSNQGDSAVTFTLLVQTYHAPNTLHVGTNEVTLDKGTVDVFTLGHLDAGTYTITVSGSADVVIWNGYLGNIVEVGSNHGAFIVTEFDAADVLNTVVLYIENSGEEAANLTVTVTQYGQYELLYPDQPTEITLSAEESSRTFLLDYLSAGDYVIELNTTEVEVLVNGEVVLSAGEEINLFPLAQTGYSVVEFVYHGSSELIFTVNIYEYVEE